MHKFLLLSAFFYSLLLSAGTPYIRHADRAPFVDGKAVESEWAKADLLSALVVPCEYSVASLGTEASMLFDDENLYLKLRAYFPPSCKAKNEERPLFGDNNFELFLMPEPGRYLQVALSRSGKRYIAMAENARRQEKFFASLQTFVVEERNYWQAGLIIPFALLGMELPRGQEFRLPFNICRHAIDLPDGKTENSSFAVLDFHNYHDPSKWAEAVFSWERGEAKVIIPSSADINVNLLPNSEFNLALQGKPIGWHISPRDTVLLETSEFSGQWVVRGTGKAYQVLSIDLPYLKGGKEYTLRLKARQFNGPNAIGMLQLHRDPVSKKLREGSSAVWKLPLTDQFNEYTIHFQADEKVSVLSFYRFGEDKPSTGADYDSIQLFTGKLPAFEIRKIARLGRKAPVPGTEMLPKPNLYGAGKNTLRVLALCEDLISAREAMEIFSGLNVLLDIISTTGEDSDTYYTDQDPAEINRHLEENAYDLYMAGRNLSKIGKQLATYMIRNIENGAGMIIANATEHGNFTEFLQKYPLKKVADGSPLAQAFPRDFLPLKSTRVAAPQEGKAGAGGILFYNTAFSGTFIFPHNDPFPIQEFTNAWLARSAFFLGGKISSRISSAIVHGRQVELSCDNLDDAVTFHWQLIDKIGELRSSGESPINSGKAVITPPLTVHGKHLLAAWLKDKDGKVLDFCSLIMEHEAPFISVLEDKRILNAGNIPADISVKVQNAEKNMVLHWLAEDFSGRIIEKGSLPATESSFQMPIEHFYSNYIRLRVLLKHDDRLLDERIAEVFVQDRDRQRLLDDFSPCIWPFGANISQQYVQDTCRQLEQIGIRSLGFDLGDKRGVLAKGLGIGAGSAVGGGAVFCAWKQDSNIRKQQFNTKESRNMFANMAAECARKNRKFGALAYQICDEPGLARFGETDELDAHPENLQEYRRRMQEKYQTIEQFNQRCRTNYKDFMEIEQGLLKDARNSGNFAEFIEWRNFNTDRWCEIVKLLSDNCKKMAPETLFSIPNTFGQSALSGNDYWKLLTKAGLDFSQEYTSMVYMGGPVNPSPIYDFDEFYRSFAPNMRVWGYNGYVTGKDRLMFQPWWFATHRYGGFTWFSTFGGVIRKHGLSTPWNLIDIPSGALTVDAEQLKQSLEESELLTGMGKLFLEYEWSKRAIAIYYSHESMLTSFCLGKENRNGIIDPDGPMHDFYFSRHQLRYQLEEMLFQYDFVAPEQVTRGKLEEYKVLFMPRIIALADDEISALKNFLAKGGRIIADILPGAYDELGIRRQQNPLDGLKNIHLTGSNFSDKDPRQCADIHALLSESGLSKVLHSSISPSLAGREAMHFRKGQMNVFVILHNPVRGAAEGDAQTITLPEKGHLYDLREGRYLGHTDKCQILLTEKFPAAVFGCYPYEVTGLQVDSPRSLKAGADLCLELAVQSSEGSPGPHLMHLALTDPAGNSRFHLKRNLVAENGKANLRMRMAFNDSKGQWQLLVKDVMTGMTATRKFSVE